MAEKEVRLIDANALDKALEGTIIRFHFDKVRMFRLIENAPTIDPENLRPHGKWILIMQKVHSGRGRNYTHYCSNCGQHGYDDYKSCPHCDAKMDTISTGGSWLQNWN